jgi:hypothetical protein
MRLTLHTFQKDVRRFWPAAVVLWLVLGGLANADRMRAYSQEIYGEGYLTLLTAMAWACLVGLVTLEEPLTGDRNFWTTRPHRWGSLLGSKLLFAALAIHLPSFLMEMVALATVGFPPAESVAPLLRQQALFFGVLTLPAMALASLVRNFTHFVLLILAFATAFLAADGALGAYARGAYSESVSHLTAQLIIAAAAIATLWIQYARRRLIYARAIMIAGAIAAVFLLNYQAYAGLMPSGGSPRISLSGPILSESRQSLVLPIEISGVPNRFRLLSLNAEALTPDGTRLRTPGWSGISFRPWEMPHLFVSPSAVVGGDHLTGRLGFYISGSSGRFRGARVRIRGQANFALYVPGRTITISVHGRHAVPGLGWCTTVPQLDTFSGQTIALKLVCESLLESPNALVTLHDGKSGWRGMEQRGSQVGTTRGLHGKWFSPIHLVSYYFHVLNPDRFRPYPGAASFMIPEAAVHTARFEITPESSTRHTVSDFDFGELNLPR